MCGICGTVGWAQAQRGPRIVEAMLDRLRHRGPDDQGVFVAPDFACVLGHRRLSIIDLQTGRQPIPNEDGSVQVILNGEIYNYRELRRDLEARGHRFRTKSDTEVIAHGYEEFGADWVSRLDGMFAIAIWDCARRQLVLSTDRFGKKPIYYTSESGNLTFASEVDALLPALQRRVSLDADALQDYLYLGWIRAPRSIYREIRRLPPATILVWRDRELLQHTYWRFPASAPMQLPPEAEADHLLAVVTEAVRKRLVADVPLGAFLSAGTDSALVVALMSDLVSGPVKTFTIGFEGDPASEHEPARRLAAFLGTDHHEEIITSSHTPMLLSLCASLGEPLGDPSLLPTYLVSRLARESVTVALSGDGGDELFGGYSRYRKMMLANWLAPIARAVWRSMPPLGRRLLARAAPTVSRLAVWPPKELYLRMYGGVLLSIAADGELGIRHDHLRRWMSQPGFPPLLGVVGRESLVPALQACDIASYLPDDILTKVDRCSMQVSLEVRCPLLDPSVARFACTLPLNRLTSLRRGKVALRDALHRRIPRGLVLPGKRGFAPSQRALPFREWGNLCASLVLDDKSLTRSVLGEPLARYLAQRITSRPGEAWWPAFGLLALEVWYQPRREVIDIPTPLVDLFEVA